MNKKDLVDYLERIDSALMEPASLYIYGSAVCILLDEPERTSLDIDVAAPYSDANYGALRQAAEAAGLPINPATNCEDNHIEWIQLLRLCLPAPGNDRMILWQGASLTIEAPSVPDLIASKLIRYDEIDRGDVQYLCSQSRITCVDVEASVSRLPDSFANDVLVLDNLDYFKEDLVLWNKEQA